MFGSIEIAKTHRFSESVHGFSISPELQSKMVYVGQLETYGKGVEVLEELMGVKTNDAQLYRVTDHYGGLLKQLEAQNEPEKAAKTVQMEAGEVVYAAIDGSMILTEASWKEVKLGRIFREQMCVEAAKGNRNGRILESQYAAVLGDHIAFSSVFEQKLAAYEHLGDRLVFLSDGALWIKNWLDARYPKATQVLDFYHVKEHLGHFAQLVWYENKARHAWLDRQTENLLNGRLTDVLAAIRTFKTHKAKQAKLANYLESNRHRIQYDLFLNAQIFIGSGAIEAAHRTVIQDRLKKSGQRWSINGAQNILNLRVAYMSGAAHKIVEIIRNPVALAA